MAQLRLLRFLPQSKHQRPLQLVTVAALGVGLSFTLLTPGVSEDSEAPAPGPLTAEDWQTHVQFAQMDTAP